MSFAHIKLTKLYESEEVVCYEVTSPDFDDRWVELARVIVNKLAKTYEFEKRCIWADERVVPPAVYALSEEERERALKGEFAGYGYGAWTGRLMSRLSQLLNSGIYPNEV